MRSATGPVAAAIDSERLEALVYGGGISCDRFVGGSHLGSLVLDSFVPSIRRAVPGKKHVIVAVEKCVVVVKKKRIFTANQRFGTSPTSRAKGGILR